MPPCVIQNAAAGTQRISTSRGLAGWLAWLAIHQPVLRIVWAVARQQQQQQQQRASKQASKQHAAPPQRPSRIPSRGERQRDDGDEATAGRTIPALRSPPPRPPSPHPLPARLFAPSPWRSRQHDWPRAPLSTSGGYTAGRQRRVAGRVRQCSSRVTRGHGVLWPCWDRSRCSPGVADPSSSPLLSPPPGHSPTVSALANGAPVAKGLNLGARPPHDPHAEDHGAHVGGSVRADVGQVPSWSVKTSSKGGLLLSRTNVTGAFEHGQERVNSEQRSLPSLRPPHSGVSNERRNGADQVI